MADHTPTPWTSKRSAFPVDGEYDYGITAVLMDGKPYCIVEAVGRCSDNFTLNAQANAAFIVKACNSHDALVSALQLHAAWEALPTDRGGKNGTKGRAWTAFIAARDAALQEAGR